MTNQASKHTPGPWVVKSWTHHDKHGAIESCGDQVVARLPNGDEFGIFTTAMEGESLADLHLIAAAPELLAVLRKFRDQFDAFDPSNKASRHAMRMALIECDSIIAKATGGAQ